MPYLQLHKETQKDAVVEQRIKEGKTIWPLKARDRKKIWLGLGLRLG